MDIVVEDAKVLMFIKRGSIYQQICYLGGHQDFWNSAWLNPYTILKLRTQNYYGAIAAPFTSFVLLN